MHAPLIRIALAALLFGALASAGAPASADVTTYTATLDGKSEVPPNDAKASGTVEAKYDTQSRKLTWTVTYTGLSGPVTAAHFHGPAKPGANAGPEVTIAEPLASPIKGETTLTPEQANDLAMGLWYVNLHTAKNPPGEVRGQLVKK
jgi:hypothetical protein